MLITAHLITVTLVATDLTGNQSSGIANVEILNLLPLEVRTLGNENQITVYPNPGERNDVLNISATQVPLGMYKISTVSMEGKSTTLLEEELYGEVEKRINISGLRDGVYVLTFSGSELTWKEKLVITK